MKLKNKTYEFQILSKHETEKMKLKNKAEEFSDPIRPPFILDLEDTALCIQGDYVRGRL